MQVEGAVIREQGQEFAIVVVKRHAVNSYSAANDAIASFEPIFSRPVVLMAQDGPWTSEMVWSKRYCPFYF